MEIVWLYVYGGKLFKLLTPLNTWA